MNYHRFQILITADRTGGYTIQALTPKGQCEVHVEPPWPNVDASAFSPLRREPGAFRDLTLGTAKLAPSPETLGDQLFRALFQGDLLGLYTSSLDAAASTRTGLRIELTFDPQNSDLAAVQALPWELLRPPGVPGFLGLNPRTPLTRFLIVSQPIATITRPQTLRILAVRPLSPRLPTLDLIKELHNLQEAVGSVAQVIPVSPTLEALRQALCGPESHVLHFMGHAMGGQTGNALLFEDKYGNPDLVTGTVLANLLAASPSLRLVVLNACDSASVQKTGARGQDFNPFAGVANALVLAGLPAVIGMQHPISDPAAITFSRIFYQQLAKGEPVDAAVTESRRAMYVEDRDSLEWTTPVLFLRAPHGDLFQLEKVELAVEPGPEYEEPSPTGPKVLATFQKDIYRLFDDIGLRDMAAYRQLRSEERRIVQHEVIRRMAGLGVRSQNLLEIGHLNARFSASDLLQDQGVRSGRGEIQRKSALFSSHSLATLPIEWALPESDVDDVRGTFDESTLQLLLDHRPLVEAGKMSVVPRLVYQQVGYEPRRLFEVKKLRTVGVNLMDDWARSAFTRQGKMFQAAVVLDASAGGLVPLEDILEIEERYATEYDRFQTRLRGILDTLRDGTEDDTKALRRALLEVDDGIQLLEGRYQAILQKRRDTAGRIGAGGLAILLYGLGASELAFLVSAFAASALSGGIRLIRQLEEIPDEIRASPFFVPWLTHRQEVYPEVSHG